MMRQPIPQWAVNAPELLPGLEFYFTAFMDLTGSRSIGFGEGPISWETIHFYCAVHELDEEMRDDMFYHIRHMDSAYLKWKDKKRTAERQVAEAAGKQGNRRTMKK